jgi:hypothetical protein
MMPALKISPSQFAFVVSVYAFSAGTSAARLVTGLFGGVIGSIVGA